MIQVHKEVMYGKHHLYTGVTNNMFGVCASVTINVGASRKRTKTLVVDVVFLWCYFYYAYEIR